MKRWLLGTLVLLAACGDSSRPSSVAEAPAQENWQEITLSDSLLQAGHTDTIDMGRIHAGEQVKQELLLSNDFSDPLLILSVKTSCGCTRVEFPKTPILPGQRAPFSFTFDSRGFSGFQLKSITLSTSASSRPRRLVLVGEVI